MDLVDTHCHIHEIVGTTGVADKWHKAGVTDADHVITDAKAAGVAQLICVGCTLADSRLAIDFARDRNDIWASIGIHPHEAQDFLDKSTQEQFRTLAVKPKVIAVGECGLDYFYNHSPKEAQEKVLRFQIELALEHNLPMIFHVREAFDDFWPIFDEYQGIRGVLHSFTDTKVNMEHAVAKGLHIGVNGIATFTKDSEQLEMYKNIPLDHLLLETDAPFLTPAPYRGTICESKHVRVTSEFLATLRGEHLEELASVTTRNASRLFSIDK
jgi:TatD DNase family protein